MASTLVVKITGFVLPQSPLREIIVISATFALLYSRTFDACIYRQSPIFDRKYYEKLF